VNAPERAGDVKQAQADISLAKRVLGYSPRYSLEEGLTATISWFQEVSHIR